MDEFPPNSRKSRERAAEPKKVERVTSAQAVRRRKPLGKQFHHVFFGGDARSAVEYVITDVFIPSAKDMLVEGMHSWVERVVYGDSHRSRRFRGPTPPSGPAGHISYNRIGSPQRDDRPPLPRSLGNRTRSGRHDFDEIVINSRPEAEEVLDSLYEMLSKYESVSVADLYSLTGLKVNHTDYKWGWTDLRGAKVSRLRAGGYLLDLPQPEYFD